MVEFSRLNIWCLNLACLGHLVETILPVLDLMDSEYFELLVKLDWKDDSVCLQPPAKLDLEGAPSFE